MALDPAETSKPSLSGRALHQAIRNAIGKHLDLHRFQVFLFGSETTQAASPHASDIDIGILGPEPVSSTIMVKIRTELESLRTLRQFDLVDFRCVDETFKAVALQKIIALNE